MSESMTHEITYERLEKTLDKLGFVKTEGDTFTAFSDESHGALIVLPQMAPNDRVSDQHLIAVERTLEGKGVASPQRFYEALAPRMPGRPKVVTGGTVSPGMGRQAVQARRALVQARSGSKRSA